MDVFVILAIVGVLLLLAELLLPTGGVLAVLGSAGLVAGGVVALSSGSDSTAAEVAGPALITIGVLSVITFFVVGRKVLEAHRDEPVRAGHEELIGAPAEVRTPLDPTGQVWIEGALWRARLDGDWEPPRPGDRVIVDAIDGLTLLVRPEPRPRAEEGAG
jgi:membrane-bound serine protease (ClpP class)